MVHSYDVFVLNILPVLLTFINAIISGVETQYNIAVKQDVASIELFERNKNHTNGTVINSTIIGVLKFLFICILLVLQRYKKINTFATEIVTKVLKLC